MSNSNHFDNMILITKPYNDQSTQSFRSKISRSLSYDIKFYINNRKIPFSLTRNFK